MTVSITGLTFTKNAEGATPNQNYVMFVGYGTYTAADFTITADDGLGFTPKKVKVLNLTDRTETVAYINSGLGTSNAEGLKTVAAGTRTYAAHGVTVGTRKVIVDVSVAGPITDDDDFVIECWG
jgi:hypothetical protein